MGTSITDIYDLLQSKRLPLYNEKELQRQVSTVFTESGYTLGVDFFREFYLSEHDIPDFYFCRNQVAVEIKIKGSARGIYSQCVRYCESDKVQSLLLVTNKAMGFPKTINNKPCYVLNIGKSWL